MAAASMINYAQETKVAWDTFVHVGYVDDVTSWENRLAGLKSKIPFKEGRVGYISGDPQMVEFILTQYAILPLVLQGGTDTEWIIANYPGRPIHLILEKKFPADSYSVENYGYGLYLIHKKN
jgi:hypothetical protein